MRPAAPETLPSPKANARQVVANEFFDARGRFSQARMRASHEAPLTARSTSLQATMSG